jgi:hypothetical protein
MAEQLHASRDELDITELALAAAVPPKASDPGMNLLPTISIDNLTESRLGLFGYSRESAVDLATSTCPNSVDSPFDGDYKFVKLPARTLRG